MLCIKRGTASKYFTADADDYGEGLAGEEAYGTYSYEEIPVQDNPKSLPVLGNHGIVLAVQTCWTDVAVIIGTVVLVLGLFYMSRSMHSLWGLLILSLIEDKPLVVLSVKQKGNSK